MSYRFKGPKVIINGEVQHITPAPLPTTVEDGCFAVDSVDGKFKVYNQALSRWIVLGDAQDTVFDNTNTLFTTSNVEDALKEVSNVVEGNFNFSNAVGFEVSDDVYLELLKAHKLKLGFKYDKLQLLGIWWATAFGYKRNPFRLGNKAYICSELVVAETLQKLGYKIDKEINLVTPKDVERYLTQGRG